MRRLALLFIAACGTQAPDPRFANLPAVATVNDRLDVPVPPKVRDHKSTLYFYDGMFHRRITRALELPSPQRALGVNALDEVPSSTWFTNRIGIRDLTIAELVTGPVTIESPELHKPWTIVSTKTGGTAVGFVVRDARGEMFLLKPDLLGYPEVETAADVIVNRVLWALGYNVPENHVVYVHPRDLLLAPDAKNIMSWGSERTLTREDLDRRLGFCEFGPDGTLRALASRIIKGKSLGGHPQEGRRLDDPNDRIPHERRRDLRGAYPIFAWLDHVDATEDNTLDMWIADPADPKRHYVKHYFVDFGKSFGVMATMGRDLRRGHMYRLDYSEMFASLVTLGLVERDWEDRESPNLRGVALYEVEHYDPAGWKASTQAYLPIRVADDHDKFWGAKQLMRFTPEQLRAIVGTARFTDPRSAEYVTDVLIARQRATAAYWFERVAPLDRFAVREGELCFDDLTLSYQLVDAALHARTQYKVRYLDSRERLLANAVAVTPDAYGHACVPLDLARSPGGYNIVELAVSRGNGTKKVQVHVMKQRDATRVIGIWRP